MISTLEQRIQISGIYINGDVRRFGLNLDDSTTHDLMITLSLIISILAFFGRLVEVTQETLRDHRIIQTNILIKVITWIIRDLTIGLK